MSSTARLELRLAPKNKELIELAAKLSNTTITAFVTDIVVARARELVEGPAEPSERSPRPIGGWTFALPDDWDHPLEDMHASR